MSSDNSVKAKFSKRSFGLAVGVTKGLCLMLLAWAGALWGVGLQNINDLSHMYRGYEATFMGGVVGAIWGLVIGFIFGVIFAYVYNCGLCCCYGEKRKSKKRK